MASFNSTTNPNPLKQYDALSTSAIVGFKAGSQTALNALRESGNAIEGVFYLTNDTHKLYIGRKDSTTGKIIPEQVSRGVTVVENVSDLDFPVPAPSGAIEEGELFYITSDNILAALHFNSTQNRYEWVQINPPTGITSFDITPQLDSSNNLMVQEVIGAENGSTTASWKLLKGNNITFTVTNSQVKIAATNTTYTAAVGTSTNQGIIGLKKDGGSTIATAQQIKIVGANGTLVSSDSATTTVTISSITLTGIDITNTTAGYLVGINGFQGDGETSLGIPTVTFSPVITYGKTNETTSAIFNQNIATLDVYSITQTDAAIDAAISARLKAADAMTYMGTASDYEDLRAKVIANGGAHNGDVYKVSTTNNSFILNGEYYKTGDLIILHGTEDATDKVIKINGATVSASTTSEQFATICDIIPSGDEPVYESSVTASSISTAPSSFSIYDANNNSDQLIDLSLKSGTLINVTSVKSNATAHDLTVTVSHATVTRNNVTTSTVTTSIASVTDVNYKFFALAPNSASGYGVKTDTYGHVTNLYGKVIELTHNRLSGLNLTYIQSGAVELEVTDSLNTSVTATLSFTSSNLTISGDSTNHNVSINLHWGTFN